MIGSLKIESIVELISRALAENQARLEILTKQNAQLLAVHNNQDPKAALQELDEEFEQLSSRSHKANFELLMSSFQFSGGPDESGMPGQLPNDSL